MSLNDALEWRRLRVSQMSIDQSRLEEEASIIDDDLLRQQCDLADRCARYIHAGSAHFARACGGMQFGDGSRDMPKRRRLQDHKARFKQVAGMLLLPGGMAVAADVLPTFVTMTRDGTTKSRYSPMYHSGGGGENGTPVQC